MRALYIICVGIMLSACGGGVASVSGNPPKWYVQSKSTSSTYYGVGSGATLSRAKAAAANDIASNLSVSVSSDTNIKDTTVDGMLSSSSTANVALSVADVELPQLEVSQNEHKNGVYYVQLSISKSDLASHFSNMFDDKIQSLKSIAPTCNTISAKDYITLKNGISEASKAANLANGVRKGSADMDDLEEAKKILFANSPRPATRFELNVEGADESLFKAAISKELINFYKIDNSTDQIVKSKVIVSKNKNKYTASVEADITLCGDVVFSTAFSDTQKTTSALANRAGILLYKKILEWSEEQ